MNLGLTLTVAISLAFTYVLAALLASTVNEMIAGILKLRGVYLTKAIESLTTVGADNGFAWGGKFGLCWLHAHLFQRQAKVSRPADKAALDAYKAGSDRAAAAEATAANIAAAMKGVANFDTLKGLGKIIDDTVAALPGAPTAAQLRSVVDSILPTVRMAQLQKHPLLVGTPTSLPSYVPSRDFASALLSTLTQGAANANAAFTQAQATIAALPDGDLKTTLQSFINSGAATLDDLRKRVEHWFDDATERLGGIYKRFSQYVMVALGLIIAVFMNVDSIRVATTFWYEPALTQAIATGAAAYVDAHKDSLATCEASEDPKCIETIFASVQQVADQQKLPIGRATNADVFGCVKAAAKPVKDCTKRPYQAWTILGWLITAFAISLGAQFWFGVLTNLTSLRSSGDKPKRADETVPTS